MMINLKQSISKPQTGEGLSGIHTVVHTGSIYAAAFAPPALRPYAESYISALGIDNISRLWRSSRYRTLD